MVPYRSNGSARRAMMARTMSSAGNRALGRMPYSGAGGRAPAPGPGLTYQAPNSLPFIPYEAAKRMQLGGLGASTVQGAAAGASAGASIGSVIPLVGTAVGAILGGIGGAIASAFSRKDQEVGNFDQAVAMWQVNPDNVYAIGNKYLPLAGLFDLSLRNPHIPIYQKYGRMGEQRFVTDLVNLIYSAAQQGRITTSDTPLTIMNRIVQPWIDSWGFGQMVDPHADLINRLIIGMILDYISGRKSSWNARGGDNPFTGLPNFSLPQPVAPAPVAAPPAAVPTPVPQLVVTPSVSNASPGTTLQRDTNASMATPYGIFVSQMNGVFKWQAPGSSSAIDVAYSPTVTRGAGTLQLQWTGNQVVANNSDGTVWGFNPNTGQFVQITAAQAATPAPAPPPSPVVITHDQTGMPIAILPPTTAPPRPVDQFGMPITTPTPAQVPSGFNQVATDQMGNPVFSNAQGVLYSWNGAAMTQFTGQLGSGSNQAAQVQAAIQAALAQGYSAAQAAQAAIAQQQATGAQVPPAIVAQAPAQAAATAAAPQTAGIGGALSGSTGLIAVGLTLVGLMFATARPAGNPGKGRRRG